MEILLLYPASTYPTTSGFLFFQLHQKIKTIYYHFPIFSLKYIDDPNVTFIE